MLSFKQLKQEVGLKPVLSHYGLLDHLEQKGKSLRGACPFCEASADQPFSVSLEKNAFQCFACKASGNLFDLVARFEGIDISKGIRAAAMFVERTFLSKDEKPAKGEREVKHEAAPNEDPSGRINPPLTFALKGIDSSHCFLEKLGIQEKTAAAFGAGVYSGKGMFKNHFVIPILNPEGKLIAYNGIPMEGNPNPVYPPKFVKESLLFHLNPAPVDDCQDDTGLILVRDPLQVLVLAAAGFPRAVAWMSDTLTREQLRQLLLAYGAGKRITLICASADKEIVSNLAQVLPLFFVRLIRYERKVAEPAGFAVNELNELRS